MYSCSDEIQLAKEFPKVRTLVWMSQSGNTIAPGIDGLLAEIQACAQSVSALPAQSELRPLRDLSEVYRQTEIFFQDVTYYAIDSIIAGGDSQDADNRAAIRGTVTAAAYERYMQSAFINGLLGNWEPNFFNPSVVIRGGGQGGSFDQSSGQYATSAQDLMIGMEMPYCMPVMKIFDNIQSIRIYGHIAQYIPTSESADKFQMYPIKAVAKLRFRG